MQTYQKVTIEIEIEIFLGFRFVERFGSLFPSGPSSDHVRLLRRFRAGQLHRTSGKTSFKFNPEQK